MSEIALMLFFDEFDLQRDCILIERKPDYVALAERRIRADMPALFAAAAPPAPADEAAP